MTLVHFFHMYWKLIILLEIDYFDFLFRNYINRARAEQKLAVIGSHVEVYQ